jgi:GntR family transcriptional regulator, rspAB operon transcriptional repressor
MSSLQRRARPAPAHQAGVPSREPPAEPTLDRHIADEVMKDIIDWRFEPGHWIRERRIAERFGVSHGPVREAFRHLSREGFVEIVPWRGARVIQLELHRVHDVLELQKVLFGTVCRLAAERFLAEDAEGLLGLLQRYDTCVRNTTDTVEHNRVALIVGSYICDRCGSALAVELLTRVARLARWQHHLMRHELVAHLQPGLGMISAAQFRKTGLAIIARDGYEAENAAQEMIASTQFYMDMVIDAQLAAESQRPKLRQRRSPARKAG